MFMGVALLIGGPLATHEESLATVDFLPPGSESAGVLSPEPLPEHDGVQVAGTSVSSQQTVVVDGEGEALLTVLHEDGSTQEIYVNLPIALTPAMGSKSEAATVKVGGPGVKGCTARVGVAGAIPEVVDEDVAVDGFATCHFGEE